MAKSKDKRSAEAESQQKRDKSLIQIDAKSFDPTLSSLFASSAGPVQAPPKSRYQERIQRQQSEGSSDADDEVLSELESEPSDAEAVSEEEDDDEEISSANSDASSEDESEGEQSENEAVLAKLRESALNGAQEKPNKKRKRGDKEEIEETYMRKLAREEEKEEQQRQKKRKSERAAEEDEDDEASEAEEQEEAEITIPKHESLAETTDKDASELEKASRTIFLGNVSTECINSKSAEKALKKHLESFISDLADNKPPHKIESIRFRSTAFASALPKRAAFAKKEIMDSTTKSTNAYAVYTTTVAAREAVKRLNGSVLLKRHLHVDSVAHPRKVDHRRCVFVGNLPFVDDESQTPNEDGSEKKKKKTPSDVEEGLWVHFSKVGKIESVRVVRDAQTRVGKGFAYVQFIDENGVEAALQLNEKKYPPMLPRILRVTRCKAEKKNKDKPRGPPPSSSKSPRANGKAGYAPKMTEEQKSMQGRARSMLGKVAKAQTKESFVFEGHRASERQGKSGLKFKGSGGKKKGPNGRKARSSAWKKTGAKK
ncbi:Nucleolar protein 12 [Neocucurbitaria cava]|uniref:Nucleolar protein 12 n=1 Tax=Neocucurbitaria cava TaxID=798079 RepID=A0A9W8YAV0_9PLEO|nr:Nucleolar protein 12 [Neocucurbitaria cava]